MALKDRFKPPIPESSRAITCALYESNAGGRRCRHYVAGGGCSKPDQPVCTEWAKVNGRAPASVEASPARPETPRESPAPGVGNLDLFGLHPAETTPAPRAKKATSNAAEASSTIEPRVVRNVTDDEIRSFKALGVEVCLASDSFGEIWVVSEYTGRQRREISVEHAATLTAICAAFPEAKVIRYEQVERPAADEPAR